MSACKCNTPENLNTEIVVGDSVHWSFVFTDNCDDPIDATGWEIWVILKKSVTDADEDAILKIRRQVESSADSLAGKVTVTLRSSESAVLTPGKYHYEFKRVLPSMNPKDVWTFAKSSKGDLITVAHGTYIENLL